MAIIGNPFEDYVKEQITVRQKALAEGLNGSNPRKLATLKAYNTSTPWMRLSSAINVTNAEGRKDIEGKSVYELIEKEGGFGFDWKNDSLSKNFVLTGIVTPNTGSSSPSGKIGSNKNALEGAYGFGYSQLQAKDGRGYVPPPGVTSVDFEYKNDGALAFATVNIKAFSEIQFQIIDILYQRPGYTCLLEFGHSAYLDNNENYVQSDPNTGPFNYIFKPSGEPNYYDMAELIQNEKRKRDGNYEGFFGRITKFNWKFNTDGSYDITVKLTGTGDVISSLRVNGPKLTIKGYEGQSKVSGEKIQIPKEKEKNWLNKKIAAILPSEDDDSPLVANAIKSQLNFELYSIFENDKVYPHNGDVSINDFTALDIPIGNKKYNKTFPKSVCKINVNNSFFGSLFGGEKYSPVTSIKFSVLLAILQKCCNIKDSKGKHLLNFSMLEDIAKDNKEGTTKYDNTYIVTYPGNFSSNPSKCLIKYFAYDIDKLDTEAPQLTKSKINNKLTRTSNNEDVDNPWLAMRLSDVYVDIGFITQVLSDLQGQDTDAKDEIEVPLLDFLKTILSGINSSLGGLNDFRIRFDEQTNRIDIISENPILNKKNPNTNFSIINTFGITKDQGSFVTDMGLNSELTDQFATQISIGAQANSSTTIGSASSFSSYSKGLVDRCFVEKRSSLEEDETISTGSEQTEYIAKIWNEDAQEAFEEVYNKIDFGSEYISALENIVSNLGDYILSKYVEKNESPVTAFLPFNLSLTMNGLGGMKIYEAFQIDGKGLPLSYDPSKIQLIIKSLSHSVSLDGWKTKIETFAKPLTKVTVTSTGGELDEPSEEGGGSGSGSGGSGNLPAPPPSKPPADEKHRITLRRLADDGQQTYGIMTVYGEDGKAIYALPTVELPWKGNQNGVSCIPPNDTYRVKSHTSGKHGKCFWIVGNGQGGYKFNALYGNGYVRSAVLIHKSPIAPGWLQGCIGPGLKFNKKQTMKDKYGGSNTNPLGTGDFYLNPSKAQSQQAVNKLLGTLYSEGSFLMKIKNLNDVGEGKLPKTLSDSSVQAYVNSSGLYKKLF